MSKRSNPLQYASGYTLDLYCDTANEEGHDYGSTQGTAHAAFTGETFAECAREARRAGWVIHRKTRTATCPKCSKSGK